MNRSVGMVIVFLMLSLGFSGKVLAQDGLGEDYLQSNEQGYKLNVELEYLAPVDDDREIETTTLNILYSKANPRYEHVAFYYGASLSYATGYIIRKDKKFDNSAFGIGPILLVRYKPFEGDKFSFFIDASGALLIYNERFPAGGDYYNFAWRVGPTLSYQINERTSLSLSYRLLHISNGQHARNPAYNANGISLGITWSF